MLQPRLSGQFIKKHSVWDSVASRGSGLFRWKHRRSSPWETISETHRKSRDIAIVVCCFLGERGVFGAPDVRRKDAGTLGITAMVSRSSIDVHFDALVEALSDEACRA